MIKSILMALILSLSANLAMANLCDLGLSESTVGPVSINGSDINSTK